MLCIAGGEDEVSHPAIETRTMLHSAHDLKATKLDHIDAIPAKAGDTHVHLQNVTNLKAGRVEVVADEHVSQAVWWWHQHRGRIALEGAGVPWHSRGGCPIAPGLAWCTMLPIVRSFLVGSDMASTARAGATARAVFFSADTGPAVRRLDDR